MRTPSVVLAVAALLGVTSPVISQSAQHYVGGLMAIRDYLVPAPSWYVLAYNYFYSSTQFNDQNGDKVSSITVPTISAGTQIVNVSIDVHQYALVPVLMWVSKPIPRLLGAKYSAYVAPTLSNSNLSVAADVQSTGGSVSAASFGWGDPFIQPLFLGWTRPHWDFAIGEGFYPPLGKYDTKTLVLPGHAPFTVASPDNIGLGYWSNQLQPAIAWYPDTSHATAVVAALAWEAAGEKRNLNLTPGQALTLNWGLSQYVPIPGKKKLLSEIGIAGYNTWQVTRASGSGVTGPNDLSRVGAAGGELNLTYLPKSLVLTVHGFYEYSAVSQLKGPAFGVNLAGAF